MAEVRIYTCVSCPYTTTNHPSGAKNFNLHMQRYHQGREPEFTEQVYASPLEAMLESDQAATAPLEDYLVAYEDDDNIWWRTSCGHHMNLFDTAIDRIRELEAEVLSWQHDGKSP